MSNKSDGGPAFPQRQQYLGGGMSLRQWYAGRAMQGIADTFLRADAVAIMKGNACNAPQLLAKAAFLISDAMIAHEQQTDG